MSLEVPLSSEGSPTFSALPPEAPSTTKTSCQTAAMESYIKAVIKIMLATTLVTVCGPATDAQSGMFDVYIYYTCNNELDD